MTLHEITRPYEPKRIFRLTKQENIYYQSVPLQHILGNLYRDKSRQGDYCPVCNIFLFFKEIDVGMLFYAQDNPDHVTLDRMAEKNKTMMEVYSDFQKRLHSDDYEYFNKLELELAKYICPKDLKDMMQKRNEYKIYREEKKQEQRREFEARNLARMIAANQKSVHEINCAVDSIINHGIVNNCKVSIYSDYFDCKDYSVLTYLAWLYDLNLPQKCRWWINEKLCGIKLYRDGRIGFDYPKHTNKIPTQSINYIYDLIDTVRGDPTALYEHLEQKFPNYGLLLKHNAS